MKISQIVNKEKWDNFIEENDGSFLQGFDWGEFQKKHSKNVWRFAVEDKGKILTQAQVIKESFKLKNNFLYIPYGPCFKKDFFNKDKKEVLNTIIKELKKNFKKEKPIFLKIEPYSYIPNMEGEERPLKRIQPREIIILDIERNEEEILKEFHSKTRYNIGLAKKKGVGIIKDNSEKYFRFFCELIGKTAKRGGFKPHSKIYYKRMLEISGIELFSAKFQDKIIAANIMLFFKKRATYLHGASDYKYRNLMAPYLLHFSQIHEAKNRGAREYDFGGINDKKWPGVTRFKKGFGGNQIKYPLGKNLVFKKELYGAYKLFKKIL